MEKISLMFLNAYISIRFRMQEKLNELKSEENGMAAVEAIILIAVAVVIAIAIVNALTKNSGNGKGLIQNMFESILSKFNGLLAKQS